MKLQKIEEIATRQVPVWQPTLLVVLLLLGFLAVPFISKKTPVPSIEKKVDGKTLGVSTVKETINSGISKVGKPLATELQKEAGVVLEIAQDVVQQTVQSIASKSAETAKEFVFDNTLGKLLQNINTLPSDQQELIKKAICK